MKLTVRQQRTLAVVKEAAVRGQWFRARSHGERVVLANLYRKGVLERRAWRGKDGEPDAANEYQIARRVPEISKENANAIATTWNLAVTGELPGHFAFKGKRPYGG